MEESHSHGKPNKEKIEGSFPCQQCDKSFAQKDFLQRHLNYECGKDPQFDCPFWKMGKGYPVKVELVTEEQLGEELQADMKPIIKKKKTATSYNRIRGNFPCQQCDRSYVRKDSLQRHLTYECGKEPQFQCPFCPQKCKRKTHQVRHIKRRHKDKIGILEENNPELILSRTKS